jgi:hypothetical protein
MNGVRKEIHWWSKIVGCTKNRLFPSPKKKIKEIIKPFFSPL